MYSSPKADRFRKGDIEQRAMIKSWALCDAYDLGNICFLI